MTQNNFNLDFAASATLTAKTVEQIVRAAVEEQTGRKVKSVRFKSTTQTDLFDRNIGTVFNGCEVIFNTDTNL